MPSSSAARSGIKNYARYLNTLVGSDPYVSPILDSDFLLEEVRLTSTAASVTFSGLDAYAAQGYKHLQIRSSVRTNRASADSDPVVLRFNADSGANYATHGLIGYNFGATTAIASNNGVSTNHAFLSEAMPVNNSTASDYGAIITDILDPFKTTKNTTVRSLAGMKDAWSSIELRTGMWNNTAAVTSITILPLIGTALASGSRFSLYGAK